MEVSLPRPAEDPDWIERQQAGLHTGDRVRVNGGQGTVEVLREADALT